MIPYNKEAWREFARRLHESEWEKINKRRIADRLDVLEQALEDAKEAFAADDLETLEAAIDDVMNEAQGIRGIFWRNRWSDEVKSDDKQTPEV